MVQRDLASSGRTQVVMLRADWVVPVCGPPIRDGCVQLERDHIVDVGTYGALHSLPSGAQPCVDLGRCILTPGLVNAHTHLELTCYAGQIEPAPFWEWIPRLVRLRAASGQVERESQGVIDGARQSLGFGVTCVGDISRRNVHWRGLKALPLRKVCYVELLSLADSPPRNMDELRSAVAEVEEDPLLTVGVTPHAPYSVPAGEIAASIALACEIDRPWTTHWMETREECAFLRGEVESPHPFLLELIRQCRIESPRSSAMTFLANCFAAAERADARPARSSAPRLTTGLLAHMNYPESDDAARVTAAGLSVAYCPRAHHFFGHPPHPYRAYLDAGVNVALGTDSVASNWSLSVLAEAQHVRRQTDNPPPADALFRMITLNPARSLGLGAVIGTLEPGKQADLAAFPCPPDVTDPVAYLIDHAPRPSKVWTAGELRIANGE